LLSVRVVEQLALVLLQKSLNNYSMINFASIIKLLILSTLLLSINSCYQAKTHGKFITEHHDAWIDGYAIRISEHEQADQGLVFCRANLKEDGSADPVCFKAEFSQ